MSLPTNTTDGASRRRVRWRYVVWVVLGLALTGAALALWSRPTPKRPAPDEDLGDDLVTSVNPGYVGIEVCAECHAKRVETFRGTRHFRASAATSPAAGFATGKGFHPVHHPDMHFEMTRRGNELLATGVRRTPDGVQRFDYGIGLIYGAGGTRDEMYFSWQDDRLFQVPIAWLVSQNRWAHTADQIEAREVTPNCLECHTTWAVHIPGTLNQYQRDDLLLGVTCERCHGPGREHAEYHRAHPKAPAHAILRPDKFDRARQMDVCAQCHTNVKRRGDLFAYRPGQPLEAHFRTVPPAYPEDNVVGDQTRALQASKCYQKSEMSCTTCHHPHRAESPTQVRESCSQCHKAESCKEQPRLPAAVRGDCAGCHLPQRVWMNVHVQTTDDQFVPIAPRADHRIGIHPQARQTVLLGWYRTQSDPKSQAEAKRLATELSTHWLNEANALERVGRFKAAIGALREALQVNPDDATKQRLRATIARQLEFDAIQNHIDESRPDAAIADLNRLLKFRPGHAPTHSRLGSIYARLGNQNEAIAHLKAVAVHDRGDASGLAVLAWLEYLDGHYEQAIAHSVKADEVEPLNLQIHYQWGLALLKLQRWAEAGSHFSVALRQQPLHAGARRGLSESLRQQGQTDEAIRHARRAVQVTNSQDPESLQTLADAYTAAQRPRDARRSLEDAIRVAEQNNPALLPTLRAELAKLR